MASQLARQAILAAALSLVACTQAFAQDFPTKQMRLIVPFAPGGAADIIGRKIAEKLGASYKQQVVVENISGAGSNIGIGAAVRAADGHTLVLASIAIAVNPSLYKSMPFDPTKDLAPLTLAIETPNVVIVPSSSNVKTLADLTDKAKSGQLNYASAGVGSSLHLAAELYKQQAKVDILHVPYRGSNQALIDLIAGRIDVIFDNASTALAQVKGGTARAIAVTTKERLPSLSDVPTVAEAGLPGYEMGNWWALFTSSKVSPEIVAKLAADLRKVLADPDLQKVVADAGGRIVASTPEELSAHLQAEARKWKQVVETAGFGGSQ
jgi:tripartite-type tricarboxylate transporter receptor subunit TctC